MGQWALKRRFFLFDTISGITEDAYTRDRVPEVVRYPKVIKFIISLDRTENERLNVPVLYIEYKSRQSSNINLDPLADVQFSTEYSMSFTDTRLSYFYLFLISLAITAVITCVCTVS